MGVGGSVLVGRDPELRELLDVVARTPTSGSAVFLRGESGIGKSRLAAEAVAAAYAAGMAVLRGRSASVGPPVPFRPLTEALLALARDGGLPSDPELGPYRAVLARLVPDWREPGGPVVPESPVVLAEAVLRMLGAVGAGRGCLLVLEDLHDADVETLAVVDYLVDNLARRPASLIVTVRDESGPVADLVDRAARGSSAAVCELRRLTVGDVRALTASVLEAPPADVPDELVDRLWNDGNGNPFVVEELLRHLLVTGRMRREAGCWLLTPAPPGDVPTTLVRSITQRVDRLGPGARDLLQAAAVLGPRFSLVVLAAVVPGPEHELFADLYTAVAAQLVAPDDREPDWYRFQHGLTADAVLSRISPAQRRSVASRAAAAVHALHPDLPGDWCVLAARLLDAAGDARGAARRYLDAGTRALAAGAAGSAVTLLEHAERLSAAGRAPDVQDEVLDSLLPALAESGRFDRAFELAARDDHPGADPGRRVARHVRLAWVAEVAGRWADGTRQVEAARAALAAVGDGGLGVQHTAPLDAVAAYLAIGVAGPDRMRRAEELARRAATAADEAGLPVTACQSRHLLGVLAREHDLAESNRQFAMVRECAERNRLPLWRIYALGGAAANAWFAGGSAAEMLAAREEALRVGAITVAHNMDGLVALDLVLRGEHASAAALVADGLDAVTGLGLVAVQHYLLTVRAVGAAHRADRVAMEAALAELVAVGGDRAMSWPLAVGLARAVCALLEENRPAAAAEFAALAATEASEGPTPFRLAGRHGLAVLVAAGAGTIGSAAVRDELATSGGRMRWNRQFLLAAAAVVAGREGRSGEAATALAEALDVARPYPTARALILRTVAEAAVRDGWGAPVPWLHEVEEYFHGLPAPAAAAAVRALLREAGGTVRRRREGTELVPADLRSLGVTGREFEVLRQLVDRPGNKIIAARLHISPRTVEKHVASLIDKTGRPHREALVELAASVVGPPVR